MNLNRIICYCSFCSAMRDGYSVVKATTPSVKESINKAREILENRKKADA